MKSWKYLTIILLVMSVVALLTFWKFNFSSNPTVGQAIDSLNGVYVFYNGDVSNVTGRNMTRDGYNLGQKYQCVEFVKRYYFEHLNHKMPDSYGHAKDFYDKTLLDGQRNKVRGLSQYSNPSITKPKVNDLIIFAGTTFNKYGHVAIISKVAMAEIEIIQQNPGPYSNSRETIRLDNKNGSWKIENKRVLGWLRKD
jgi:surface antigen